MSSTTFQGWVGENPDAVKGQMKWAEFEPKQWTENDVDIEISHCGICGSDMHTLSSGWGATPYPCVVGHEIIGKAVRVGKNVSHIKPGQRVGVGAQALSCLKPDCADCSQNQENYCRQMLQTYGHVYPNGEGKSYGGYATHNRTNGHFVFPIPDGLDSADAAPMLCAGITVYSPLKRNGCGPGKTVGIVGVGGLGHFGLLFAKALGADRVVGISRKAEKRDDVMKLGADEYIATGEEEGWETKHARSLDLIISTVSNSNMPLSGYLGLLKANGKLVQLGAPDGGKLPEINAFLLLPNGISIGGSLIGSPQEISEMLQFAADKKVKPWIEKWSMNDANKAIVAMEEGKARYRYVLEN